MSRGEPRKRGGWLSTPLFYGVLLAVTVGAYLLMSRLPQAQGVISAGDLLRSKGDLWQGLSQVWFIFAWGFGIQFLIQIWRVVRLKRREAGMEALMRRAVWLSANAGLFEEIIFRLYGFLSTIIALRYFDEAWHGVLEGIAVNFMLPVANFVTFGLFQREFTGSDWAIGMAIILGSLFFRSAHIHYGLLAKANVWLIGMVMFWLMFNYGLVAAILAHFLYDAAVFLAIAFTSPLQRRGESEV